MGRGIRFSRGLCKRSPIVTTVDSVLLVRNVPFADSANTHYLVGGWVVLEPLNVCQPFNLVRRSTDFLSLFEPDFERGLFVSGYSRERDFRFYFGPCGLSNLEPLTFCQPSKVVHRPMGNWIDFEPIGWCQWSSGFCWFFCRFWFWCNSVLGVGVDSVYGGNLVRNCADSVYLIT